MAGEWRSSTWGEEISLEYGKSLKGYRESVGNIQVFGSNGAVGWTDKVLSDGPGVILGRKGAYRGVRYSKDPFFVIDTAYYVKPKTNLDMQWLYYSIIHHKLGEIDDGSPIPSTTRAAVYVTDVDVPPLPEQKAIAHVLRSLDDKIELNRRMNETLEGMAQALFKSWFVDFDPVIDNALADGNPIPEPLAQRAETRRQAITNGTANRETAQAFPASFRFTEELGWIPEGWEVRKIEEIIVRLKVGKKFSQKTAKEAGKVPILDQGKSGIIGFHDEEPGIRASLDEPVIVFANHTCYMRLIMHDFSAIQNVLPFRGKDLNIYWLLCATIGKQNFVEYKGHWPDFVLNRVALPPNNLHIKFGETVESNFKQIFENENQSQTLAKLRDVLLPKLISGELRIPQAEKMVEDAIA